MTALVTTHDMMLAVEIDALIGSLLDAQSRRRIVEAWLLARVSGDRAMQCLIDCELIEFSPEGVTS